MFIFVLFYLPSLLILKNTKAVRTDVFPLILFLFFDYLSCFLRIFTSR